MTKLVVIGSGMAGAKFIEELTIEELTAEELVNIHGFLFDITVIGDEPYGNYDRIKLASLLLEDELLDFRLNDNAWYKAHNINALLGEKATRNFNKLRSINIKF